MNISDAMVKLRRSFSGYESVKDQLPEIDSDDETDTGCMRGVNPDLAVLSIIRKIQSKCSNFLNKIAAQREKADLKEMPATTEYSVHVAPTKTPERYRNSLTEQYDLICAELCAERDRVENRQYPGF